MSRVNHPKDLPQYPHVPLLHHVGKLTEKVI